MSSSFGGDCVTTPNASRNIVWQKGHAVPITSAPVAHQFLRALHVHSLAVLFAEEHLSAAGAAAEGPLARAPRFHHFAVTRRPPSRGSS